MILLIKLLYHYFYMLRQTGKFIFHNYCSIKEIKKGLIPNYCGPFLKQYSQCLQISNIDNSLNPPHQIPHYHSPFLIIEENKIMNHCSMV